MNSISHILCKSLQCTLHNQAIDPELYASLSDKDWRSLFELSAKQGVLAIVYDAIVQLPKELQPSRELNIRWAISTDAIEARYNKQLNAAKKISEIWHHEGIDTLVLKGFSLSKYYPIPEHRECGDFDCYLFNKYEEGNLVAEKSGARVNREWYKHSQILFQKTMIENHLYLVTTRKGEDAKSLNDTLVSLIGNNLSTIENSHILVPSTEFTALFVTYHSLSHFLTEGITLRHICDWACFMQNEQVNFDWNKFYALCQRYKFDRFVDVSNYIATKYLGLELTNPDIITESPYGEMVMNDILFEDAKIYNKGRSKWYNRVKLITNIYSYRWKYRDIAQSGSIKYLWDLVIGFITKRDKH